MSDFSLNSGLDPLTLQQLFLKNRRLQITDFLGKESASALHDYLTETNEWRLAVNRGEQILDLNEATLAGMNSEQLAKLDQAIFLGGRYGFQFRYDVIRLPKPSSQVAATNSPLADFHNFLCSSESIAFLRTITGMDDVDFVDAHASRYRAHHFLTAHDDQSLGMGRRAAYVLNLSPEWRVDWGGLLLFHDAQGNVTRGFTPSFNTLNIFAVPQAHSVSWVTPLAGRPRLAITGWLRTRDNQG